MTSEQLLAFLSDSIQALPSHRPLRVGIDGRPGAGKTTLADALADRLEAVGRVCWRAALDEFHRPGHEQREKTRPLTPPQYLQQAYDYSKIRELLLEPLGPQGSRHCRLDFWNSHDDEPFPEEWVDVSADAIVVVDGAFLYGPELRGHWDVGIWLDVDWQSMLLRRARRDGTRGGPADLIRDAYKTGLIPRHLWYEESIHPRELVDIVIDNSDVARPFIVRAPPPPRRTP